MKMGAINIGDALKQMNGVFGCKASFEFNVNTKSNEFTFAKKTIVDFFFGLFASGDEKSKQSSVVINALLNVQNQVEILFNVDELKALTTKYRNNHDLINFKEIRKTLRNFSYFKFPPVVFTQSVEKRVEAAEIKPDNVNAQQSIVAGAGLSVSAPTYRTEQNAGDFNLSSKNKNGSVMENSDLDDMLEIEGILNYESSASPVRKNRTIATGEEKADGPNKPFIEKLLS